MTEPFGHRYDSDACACGHRRDGHAGDGCCSCGCVAFAFAGRDIFQSLSQEEFDALEGPTEDEIRDSLERGWRKTRWGIALGPRRRLPEDG